MSFAAARGRSSNFNERPKIASRVIHHKMRGFLRILDKQYGAQALP
jgi:hypothetical protein